MPGGLSIPETWVALSPALAGGFAALVVLAWDALGSRRITLVMSVVLSLSAAVVAWSSGQVLERAVVLGAAAAGSFVGALAAIIYLLLALAIVGGFRTLERHDSGGTLAALMVLTAAASVVVLQAHDLIVLLIGVESLALCAYASVALGGSARADEAAMKYFVQGAVATALLVYGMAVLYGALAGSTSYESISQALETPGGVGPSLLVFTFFLAGLGFKLGAFPFHSWAPDAFETAPAPAAAVMASGPKIAVLAATGLLFAGVFRAGSDTWVPLFVVVAVASIAFGNFGGLRQLDYQRMLAYSGIAQVGYALTAFAALSTTYSAMLVFAVAYAIAVTGAFTAASAVREVRPDWDGTITGLRGIGWSRPVLGGSMAVILLSLTGIPLTAGFWGKFVVFYGIASQGWAWLALMGLVGSVVSFGYYGNVLRALYMERSTSQEEEGAAGPGTWATAIIAFVLLTIGIVPMFTGIQSIFDAIGL